MTLVDDDQIKEVGLHLLIGLLRLFRPGQRLIEGKVNFIGRIDGAPRHLGHGRAEGLEVVGLGLIDQNVAIRQKQDALLGLGLPQPPDDLEGGVGLASAGRHHQQHPGLTGSNGLNRLVDGLQLVIAWRLVAAVRVVILGDDRQVSGLIALEGAVFVPELGWRGEIFQADLALQRCTRCQIGGLVVKHKAIAVGGKDKGHFQQAGVIEPLLHPLANLMFVGLGLDHRQRQSRLVVEHDIGGFDLLACCHLAAHHHLAIAQLHLLPDLGQIIPPRLFDGRQNKLGDDVSFGELGFVDGRHGNSLAAQDSFDILISEAKLIIRSGH